jgi:hypothetical protein
MKNIVRIVILLICVENVQRERFWLFRDAPAANRGCTALVNYKVPDRLPRATRLCCCVAAVTISMDSVQT